MNEQLQKAEHALLEFIHKNPNGVTMSEILAHFQKSSSTTEADLRAAVWTLNAEGVVEIEQDRLKEVQPA